MDDVSAEEIRAKFGMPPDVEPLRFVVPGNWLTEFSSDWEGYSLELVGVVLEPEASAQLKQRAEADNGGPGKRRTKLRDQNKNTSRLDMFLQPRDSPWPYFIMEWDATELSPEDLQRGLQPVEPVLGIPSSLPDGRNLLALQLWGIQVCHADSAAYAEVRWHPVLGRREAILGVESTGDINDIIRIYRGLLLLRQTAVRGRKPGSDAFESTERLLKDLRVYIAEMHRQGKRATLKGAAEMLRVDERTLNRNLRRRAMRWGELKAEILADILSDGQALP
jgi:hypothetical protein